MLSFISILIRKIIKNRWLVLCQFFGVLIVTSLLSSIPAFSNGVMQKILMGELRGFQAEMGEYPGYTSFFIDSQIINDEQTELKVKSTEALFSQLPRLIDLPEVCRVKSVSTEYLRMLLPERRGLSQQKSSIILSAIHDIGDHIDIFDGTMPSGEAIPTDDPKAPIYEAIVSEEALAVNGMTTGRIYEVEDYLGLENKFKLKVVGVFRLKEENSPFWQNITGKADNDIYIDYDLYMKSFVDTRIFRYCKFFWSYYFDYNELKIQNLGKLLDAEKKIDKTFNPWRDWSTLYKFPIKAITEGYFEKVGKISVIMLSINVPLLFMLALFILMISMIKIGRERNEISVAASRGAGRFQISAAYFAESIIIAFLAFLAGPFIGTLIARFIGATTGFMEFINRAAIETPMIPAIFQYSLAGALSTVVLTTIPAFVSSAVSIVTRKQSIGRLTKRPFWQRIYLDAILLAVSGYGIYSFNKRMKDILKNALEAKALEIDPFMFILPALFTVALGLLFLRLYPVFVELLFKLGKKIWPPGIYASLLQTSRTITQYGFISLFIMFTIALGIFNANSARTIKTNAEDRIRYEIGGQVVIEPAWYRVAVSGGTFSSEKLKYIVPDFNKYAKMECVETLTKVYNTNKCNIMNISNNIPNVQMMAITTDEFGKVSWLRDGLLDYHWYEYLNLIALEPSAILISSSLAEEAKLKPGDFISMKWGESGYASFIVYAVIDYWPSWNPNQQKVEVFRNGEKTLELSKNVPMLIVANYKYVVDRMTSVEPWEIWLKLKPGASSADLYNDIETNGVDVSTLRNSVDELVQLQKDPFQMGLNGAMTVSFCTALLVCLTGFILFWVQSIKSRELQYGIFRAIGLKAGSIRSMLVLEQILISGVSIFIGILIGILTTNVFMKFFNLAYDPYEQVPPFNVIMESQDYVRLLAFISVMLIIGLAVLSMQVSKIKPAQALKLGED